MPRTRIELDADLLRLLEEKALHEGRSLQSVVNDILRAGLAIPRTTGYRLGLRTGRGKLQPGVDLCDRNALFGIMEEP